MRVNRAEFCELQNPLFPGGADFNLPSASSLPESRVLFNIAIIDKFPNAGQMLRGDSPRIVRRSAICFNKTQRRLVSPPYIEDH